MGTDSETRAAVAVLSDADQFNLLEVSGPYPNRGNSALVRVYIKAQLAGTGTSPASRGGGRQ
jgi:hypothetical protein